jgi:ubiquinone/menaquinone biosynthesis C-methylase UbiE
MNNETRSTSLTRKRYDRLAPYYDFLEAALEWFRFSMWRTRLTEKIRGPKALEIGVGTGKNFKYYPSDFKITAIDFSSQMLKRAKKRSNNAGFAVELREMDVQNLGFSDNSFDTIFATFVFCSVPDPIKGFRELRRVCKADGHLLLIEHMRPESWWLGCIFDLLNPVIVRMMGANINRRTIDNLRRAGWRIEHLENLSSNIVRWIEAKPV